MSRIVLLALLLYLLLVAGVGSLNGAIIGLAVPLLLYLLVALWGSPEKIQLSASRSVSLERARPGEKITVSLSVTNTGEGIEELLLHDPLPPFLEVVEGVNSRLVNLPSGKTITWSYTLRGQRGYHQFKTLQASASDRLGLILHSENFRTHGQVMILPVAPRVRHIAIRPRETRVYSGVIPARQGGTGIEFFGLREYQVGDSPRWINWRASARHRESFYVNQYEQERVADVGIILDARRTVNEVGRGRTLFEHSVLAAVTVSNTLLSEGNRVGLLVYGGHINWTMPGFGKQQQERLLRSLAMADMGKNELFNRLIIPRRLFPVSSQIILISPLAMHDSPLLVEMRLSGYQLLVISPDPVRYEKCGLDQTPSVQLAARILRLEREVALRRLRHAGIQVVDWDVSLSFDRVVQGALSRSPVFLRAIRAGGG